MAFLRLLLFPGFLLAVLFTKAQVNILNFTRSAYGAGSQNWIFEHDNRGHIYIANNEGLLTFNGSKWEVFPMPNQTIVRSIAFGKNGRLYAGGQDEIGYFESDPAGKLVYVSLLSLIDTDDRQFADVWNIVSLGDDIFFRSFSRIFRLHNNKITTYRTSSKWDFMGVHKTQLLAHDKKRGLVLFQNNEWQDFIGNNLLPADLSITSILPFQSESLVTTLANGLYKLSGNRLTPFILSGKEAANQQHFTCAQAMENGSLMAGTYEDGLYHIDSNGTIKETVSKADGLNSNNIKCIFKDQLNNIWLGLEDGISFLSVNNPIRWFNPKIFNGAAGYAATIFNNKIYFALANGIYEMPFESNQNFELVADKVKKIASGLSWKVANVQGQLFAGRDDGFFEIKGSTLQTVDRSAGYWIFKPLTTEGGELLFAGGNYLGVSFFKKQNGNYTKETDLSYLNTSARFLEYDSAAKAIWISHPYRGVYRIATPGNAVKLFTQKDGLPSSLNNHVFKINRQILVATVQGVYEFNAAKEQFELSASYDSVFSGKSLRYLQADSSGNLWFVHEKTMGLVEQGSKRIIYFPELQRRIVSGFEHIFPVDANHVIAGAEQGFFLINYKEYLLAQQKPVVFIRNVSTTGGKDSVLFGGYGKADSIEEIQLHYRLNSFHFEYAAPFQSASGNLEYSYRLKGFEEEWSNWTKKTEKDYTNIPQGDYVFEVKVRNNLLEESAAASYAFEILPPWYKTTWAGLLFLLLAVSLFYLIYKQQEKIIHKRQEKKMEEERRQSEEKQQMLTYQHQLELEKSEKELVQLKNEKLESELASTAMNLVQKKEFLLRIKDEISRLNKAGKENIDAGELKKILRSLTAEDKLDDEWEQFSVHFNRVHGNFLINLKNKFPGLKAHELKLCAYLRMNLTSKEIAQLLSISLRGVEISRYRLRKKLEVPAKEDLFQFLFNIDSGSSNTDKEPLHP
jgi:DNA-binding CsgD family transcriptional regulator